MKLSDFFYGLKTDHEDFDEKVASAEHFIRLKKQAGIRKRANPVPIPPPQLVVPGQQPAMPGQAPGQEMPEMLAAPQTPPDHQMLASMMLQGQVPQQPAPVVAQPAPQPQQPPLMMGPVKTAMARLRLRRMLEKRANDRAVIGGRIMAAAGALIGAGTSYLASRPQKELGGKGWEEDKLEGMVEHQKKHPETSFSRKIFNRQTEFAHGMAKAWREHPVKSTVTAAGVGALLGRAIAKNFLGKGR